MRRWAACSDAGLARVGVGILTQAFVAALIAGLIGVAAAHLDVDDALGLVVLCPAMVLVPGPHILNGALDLLALRVSLGIARLGYAALILAAIAAGLILGLAADGRSISRRADRRGGAALRRRSGGGDRRGFLSGLLLDALPDDRLAGRGRHAGPRRPLVGADGLAHRTSPPRRWCPA